jgi:hypothetical protein
MVALFPDYCRFSYKPQGHCCQRLTAEHNPGIVRLVVLSITALASAVLIIDDTDAVHEEQYLPELEVIAAIAAAADDLDHGRFCPHPLPRLEAREKVCPASLHVDRVLEKVPSTPVHIRGCHGFLLSTFFIPSLLRYSEDGFC